MKLYPCWHCRSEDLSEATEWKRYVECNNCGCTGPNPLFSGNREMEAISANVRWNERADLTELYLNNPKRKPVSPYEVKE